MLYDPGAWWPASSEKPSHHVIYRVRNPCGQRQRRKTWFGGRFCCEVEFLAKILFPSKWKGQAVLLEDFSGRLVKWSGGSVVSPQGGHAKPLKLESLVHQSARTAGGKSRHMRQKVNLQLCGEIFHVAFLWSVKSYLHCLAIKNTQIEPRRRQTKKS
jgi:hypothetical protein